MRPAALVVLAALAACSRPAAPPAPTTDELGAEIAQFRQVLVPLSPDTALKLGAGAKLSGQIYTHAELTFGGHASSVMIAYSNPWLAPADSVAQPMTIPQFFRAFAIEPGASAVVLIAPKGQIVVQREQAAAVAAKVIALGAADVDLPFSVVRGSLR